MTPLVCEQPTYSLCMCVTRLCTVLPRSRTGSVGVTSPRQTVDGRCSHRSFPAVVVVSDVERPVPVDVFPSYVSIPDPRCRGTRLGRSRWASGTRTKPWSYPIGPHRKTAPWASAVEKEGAPTVIMSDVVATDLPRVRSQNIWRRTAFSATRDPTVRSVR